ncbi:MAG: hypothetical protein ACJAZ3_000440 [Sphingobacteriales bacterium]|jgi:hypothetical protein
MTKLPENWITDGLIDFEYKKYILLGYLKDIEGNFDSHQLYPHLSELINHHKDLTLFIKNKNDLFDRFKEHLTDVDFKKMSLHFEKSLLNPGEELKEVESILNFALPKFQSSISDGMEIYDHIENDLTIFPIGIVPLIDEVGYIIIPIKRNKECQIFEYQITIFENNEEKFRGIKTQFVRSFPRKITTTYESIKVELIKEHWHLPNPAVFAVESKKDYPIKETLLPIAKRSVVKYVSTKS